MTDTRDSFIFWTSQDAIKATTGYKVMELTSKGYWTWQIARMLGITEYEVVALQGRA